MAHGAAALVGLSRPLQLAGATAAAAVVFAAMLLCIAKVKRGTRRVPFVSQKLHSGQFCKLLLCDIKC